jgi:hypothetical protein
MSKFDLAGLQAAAAADSRPTARLIDKYHPGDSVYEFLSARTLDTTVPPY